jgi:hypothetical protein
VAYLGLFSSNRAALQVYKWHIWDYFLQTVLLYKFTKGVNVDIFLKTRIPFEFFSRTVYVNPKNSEEIKPITCFR